MKKGFTLVELISVTVVIAIIALVAVPAVNRTIKNIQNDSFNTQVRTIKQAASGWATANLNILPLNGEPLTIYLYMLKLDGLLDNDLKNPKTDEPFYDDMEIVITYDEVSGKYDFDVKTTSGGARPKVSGPIFELVGKATVSLKVGEKYVEQGIFGYDDNLNKIQMKDVDVTYKDSLNAEIDLNTAKAGTYHVYYSYGDYDLVRTVEIVS